MLLRIAAASLMALSLAAALAAPVTVVDDRGHSVTLARVPQRIVSLSPSLSETVCALQACARLVGTDRYSTWPEALRSLPKLGGLDDTQIERLAALKPDLVLAAVSTRAVERLEALGLPVLALEPRNWAGTRRAIAAVAQALGEPAAGPALVAAVERRIAAAAAGVPARLRGRSVYFEVAATPFAAGEASFVGELLAGLGLVNIVPAALGPFPQLNPEFVLRAQPALLMASADELAQMPARPGWAALQALRRRQTCGFASAEFDTLMRAGPRLGEAAEAIVACLRRLEDLP
ncbi:ABC transporter substrate-binding protein [Rubrivivax sp. A210]|uniref:ABC transporter substrate-binding protein n=1 Tax=Rubrivivax sp. A210 TaxID=2772301 RepID=UPI00191B1479|nr:helical backbone metal receptor [Rubrivivax sp. A210]CAD5374565.1 ABC transporter substrate-binding protein [Rubrivivax sp. A210]